MTRTVSVTGVGTVSVPRDTAIVRVAAAHRAPALADALAGVESARAVLVDVARRYVDPAAVASESLDVWPAHDEAGQPVGFDARHALAVRCTDLVVAGELLTALAGGVGDRLRVEGVSLSAGDTGEAQRVGRELAVADARAKATHLAALADATLGEVLAISDGTAAPSYGGSERMAAKASVGLEPGAADVVVTVSVTWALL